MLKSKTYVVLETVIWKNDKGEYHREDGPAVEYSNGDKIWYLNDKRHRETGPAVEYSHGFKAWYLKGVEYTEKEYSAKIKTLRLG